MNWRVHNHKMGSDDDNVFFLASFGCHASRSWALHNSFWLFFSLSLYPSINCVLENVSYKIECESWIATRTVVIHKTPSAENQNNATSVYWKHVIILIHMRIIHKTHLPLFFNSQRHSVVVAVAVFSIWMKSENRTIFTNWMWILTKRETEREGRQQHSQRFELVWNSIWFLSSKRFDV